MHGVGLASSRNFAFAANGGHAGAVAIFTDVDTKIAGFFYRECEIGGVYFVEIAFAKFAHAEIDGAFGQAHLRDVFVEVEERQPGHAADMNARLTSLQFGAGIFVRPNLVANGGGAIPGRGAPVARPSGLKRNRSIEEADARHSGR